MIDLQIQEYCQDCFEFEPEVDKTISYDGYGEEKCNNNVYCVNRDKCERMISYLQKKSGAINI